MLAFGRRLLPRILVALALALGVTALLAETWSSGVAPLLTRTLILAFVAVVVFGFFERWPAQLPRWIARWALQVVSVGVTMPVTTLLIYILSTEAGAPPFYRDPERMNGFMMLTFFSVLLAPWASLAALLRQSSAFVRSQALAFELERSELARQAADARLHLLQAQVAPHFLFNTLANVQALVDAGSPRASSLLRSLIAYLRAAVPLLNEPATSIGRELDLVRAYLELMHMRMPDRLVFRIQADDDALAVRCPPTALLTLVENAVRHGIDPSEDGGAIEIEVSRHGSRCTVRVRDTGVGMSQSTRGLGTGLSSLRERLSLMFGESARLVIEEQVPRGVCAQLELPALEPAA
jgi:signal transduction histidine kinase